MYLLNLSLAQFLALFGTVSATLVLLYLLDRSRRRQVVATLRFWVAADQPSVVQRRKRIRQPLSLILQLLSLLLLLLAIAQLRFGTPLETPRDHVLILDTSAWMAASSKSPASLSQGPRTLMDDAHQKALAYVKSTPAADRIMLVRADALATPVTGFESNRRKLAEAIILSRPGSTALNLEQALAFARKSQALDSGRLGEIVYAGPGRISQQQTLLETASQIKNLRLLPVADPVENCGFIRHHQELWRPFQARGSDSGAWRLTRGRAQAHSTSGGRSGDNVRVPHARRRPTRGQPGAPRRPA
ncbi:MAG: hypothetical protein DMF60_09765 [Acidobacteria bacterium]|nr:MAG: hypothetical protein DMF60_09765 [Acidobacteriota bacterium]